MPVPEEKQQQKTKNQSDTSSYQNKPEFPKIEEEFRRANIDEVMSRTRKPKDSTSSCYTHSHTCR